MKEDPELLKRRLKAEAAERTRERTLTEEQREERAAAYTASEQAEAAKAKVLKVGVD